MKQLKIHDKAGEQLAKWYLRLNGYFTVDNFIVHAGDDPKRISDELIGNYTETDILGVRFSHHREVSGELEIQNDPVLINKNCPLIDYVIAEVKTGKEDRPNPIWRNKNLQAIAYIIRFAGIIPQETDIQNIAKVLSEAGEYHDVGGHFSIRLILIAETLANQNWKNVANISFDHIIEFLVTVRGQCWIEKGMGIRSHHPQWDPLINEIFRLCNQRQDINEMKQSIKNYLQSISSIESVIK